ncbi:hypothetical protein JXA32_08630 [Candidatus Sumerlaeota bacterium]|nr:hypothetical protein [Candidatus Sumerlaeota bacterium]
MENLGRGVVAIRTGDSSVFVSWRLLGLDPPDIGFNLYRSANGEAAVLLNDSALTSGTNFTDRSADLSTTNSYFVRPILNGEEQAPSGAFTLAANHAIEPCVVVTLRQGEYIHFTWVGDLDGDGEYDYVVDRMGGEEKGCKIEAYRRDGAYLWTVDYGPNSKNMNGISPGSATIDVGHWDGVTVYDVNSDGKAEVITKIANGVVFGDGRVWQDDDDNKQWIAVLDGMTGALISSCPIPGDYISIGPMACQLGIGCLDGVKPGVIAYMKNRNPDKSFNRLVCAYEMDETSLTMKWKWSGEGGGSDGHQIRIIDVNGDGCDDLCQIGYVLDGATGAMLYNMDQQGIVHGDRYHIGKLDPTRPGLQGFAVQQRNPNGILEHYYDAATGELLWKHSTENAGDVGRGCAADIDPRHPGYEVWSFSGIYNGPTNEKLADDPNRPWPNFRFWWDGDDLSECFDNKKIEKWNYETSKVERLLTTTDYHSAEGSWRGAPMFYGDIFGDWREEVVMRSPDHSSLIIFTTPIETSRRLYTLPHNPAYRNCMTVKGYMQSHMLDYYLGEGMTTPPAPDIRYAAGDDSTVQIIP